MRKVALIVGCLVVVLVVAVAIVPRLIGINAFKPQIADAVREATGRELRIDGDIDLALLPGIELSLSDVALSNADWAQAPDMVTVASIEVKLGLLSLLGGGVAVERLVVREPAIFLEQDAQGRGSWAFEGAQTAENAPPAGEGEAGGPVGDIRLGDPSYDIDWQSVFQAAALDPARLATMPDSLKDAAKGFGVDLPLPHGLPGAEGLGEGLGETLKGITGDGEAAPGGATGALDGLQKLIDPGAAEDAPPAAESEPQPEPQAQPEDLIEKPLDAVKGLFGN